MNEAIVWCLESFFPAPVSLEEKLEELATMVAIMKEAGPNYENVKALTDEIIDTLRELDDGTIPTPKTFGEMVNERLTRWDEEKLDEWRDKHESPFDDRIWQQSTFGLGATANASHDPGGDLDDED